MPRLALFVSLAFVLLAAHCRGQGGDDGFNLEDAFDTPDSTQKPTFAPPKSPSDDGFSLEDALGGGGDHVTKKPTAPRPNPGSHGNAGDKITDLDLLDGKELPKEPERGGDGSDSKPSDNTEGSQGMLAGIISSVVVAIAGAVSSFIAYQKKKLCFKASDQENVNMESQQGAHAEPPVQRTLLQKQ
ncbi:CD99 antigen isoform X2 [Hemicordylus capensis]|uniref:CD99 antigen isoform X2 n=1 Tax=Hemicordylus capensis TaxID=884348 RepID=UPI002303E821|nr:CD99 antigen isoform X2 [Hemicordylus capensis]